MTMSRAHVTRLLRAEPGPEPRAGRAHSLSSYRQATPPGGCSVLPPAPQTQVRGPPGSAPTTAGPPGHGAPHPGR